MSRNTGILGGTFNPVHRGHVEIGLWLKERLGLDRILYVLSAQPPHKRMMRLASPALRWRMLQAALAPHPGLVPCDLELRRDGPSWTLDTVHELRDEFPADRLCFLCGSEGFLRIETWRGWQELLALLPFAVVLRRETDRARLQRLAVRCGMATAGDVPPLPPPPAICLLTAPTPTIGLSSTEVRRRCRQRGEVDELVTKEVQSIMEESRAYEP